MTRSPITCEVAFGDLERLNGAIDRLVRFTNEIENSIGAQYPNTRRELRKHLNDLAEKRRALVIDPVRRTTA